MKSQARIDAGRRNGALARGKKSEEARQKCAQNSFKHGLFSKSLVLANESSEYFEATRKTYYDIWKPENEFEADLVNDIIAARWHLSRIMTIEKETIDLRQARMYNSGELKKEFEVIPEPVRLAIAYAKETNESNTLANLSRYGARYNRELRNATADLKQIQKDRRAEEAEAAEEAITSEPESICRNEGNAPERTAQPALKIVRSEPATPPGPVAKPSATTPEDDSKCT
jgi:hypothetical protein